MKRLLQAWNAFQFELFVAMLCMCTGLPLAIGITPSPSSVANTLPPWTLFIWGAMLSLGGLCTVTGILWRYYDKHQFIAGLFVEKAGLWMLGSCSAVLAIVIGYYAGDVGLLTAGIFGALSAACLSRIRTINKEADIVKEYGEA